MDYFSDTLERAIREVRAEIIMRAYTVAMAVGTVLFVGNMVRNLYFGNALSVVHVIGFVFFVTVFLLRERIGATRMALILAGTLYILGSAGLFLYGIAANSGPVLIGFVFLSALFFGLRGGAYAAILAVLSYAVAGTLIASGVLALRPETDLLMHSSAGWFSRVLTVAAMSGLVVAMIGQLKDRIVDLVRQQYLVTRTDALTGLPNRLTLETRLQHSLEEAHRDGSMVAVFFLDLDRFKAVNDTLGHHVGDQLLIGVARRLGASVRAVDTVGRVGSDEFVVVQEHIATEADATLLAAKMLELLAPGFRIEGHEMHCSVSIGIAMYPQHGDDSVRLLKHADLARYHAKTSGRNNFRFYAPDMVAMAEQRDTLEAGLRLALPHKQLQLYYQPQVDFEGKLCGVEALLRWASEDQGLVEPDEFLEVAEKADLLQQMGDWVLEEGCRQWNAWDEAGLNPPVLSINLAGLQVCDPALATRIAELRRTYRVPAQSLRLELHERSLVDHPEEVKALVLALAEQGVPVAVDDFGTAHSSLALLRSLKLDYLIIDRVFIREIEHNAGSLAIVKGSVSLAHTLGLRVIAEGVETSEQYALLRDKWCDELQGFLVSPPVPAAEIEIFMSARGNELISHRLQAAA